MKHEEIKVGKWYYVTTPERLEVARCAVIVDRRIIMSRTGCWSGVFLTECQDVLCEVKELNEEKPHPACSMSERESWWDRMKERFGL